MKLTPERLDELETECAETGASLSVVTRPELLALIAAARREAKLREALEAVKRLYTYTRSEQGRALAWGTAMDQTEVHLFKIIENALTENPDA